MNIMKIIKMLERVEWGMRRWLCQIIIEKEIMVDINIHRSARTHTLEVEYFN